MDEMRKDVLREIIAEYHGRLVLKCRILEGDEREELEKTKTLVGVEKDLLYTESNKDVLNSIYDKIEKFYSQIIKEWNK